MSKIFAALVIGAALLGTGTPSLAGTTGSATVSASGDVIKGEARHRSRRGHVRGDQTLPECDPLALILGPCRGRVPQLPECDPLALTLKPCR